MRPDDWYMHMDERVASAKAAGWTADDCGKPPFHFWIVSANDGQFAGYGYTEDEAWSDILADAELWDEVTAALADESGNA